MTTRLQIPHYRHRVLYGDTDRMGIVYYANYLRFFEGARNEWIRALGLTYVQIEERGIMLPVLEAAIRYLRPARYDDLLEIQLRVVHTRVKIRFDYVVYREGEKPALCLGHTVHACVNAQGRPTRAPDWLALALAPAALKLRTLAEAPAAGAAAPDQAAQQDPEKDPDNPEEG